MKKLILILAALLGSLSFVACGKKDEGGNACQGYPAGYKQVTDQRMLQQLNSGYGSNYGSGYGSGSGYNYGGNYGGNYYGNNYYGNNNYGNNYDQNYGQNYGQNNGVICVDQYAYDQLREQAYGNGTGGNTNGYPPYGGGGSGGSNQYCQYYPYDPICSGGYYY